MKRLIYIIAACMTFASCSNGKSNSEKSNGDMAVDNEPTNGKYFYVDDSGCVHVNLDCMVFLLDSSNYAVRRFAISDTTSAPSPKLRYCSRCVSDEEYRRLIDVENTMDSIGSYGTDEKSVPAI